MHGCGGILVWKVVWGVVDGICGLLEVVDNESKGVKALDNASGGGLYHTPC